MDFELKAQALHSGSMQSAIIKASRDVEEQNCNSRFDPKWLSTKTAREQLYLPVRLTTNQIKSKGLQPKPWKILCPKLQSLGLPSSPHGFCCSIGWNLRDQHVFPHTCTNCESIHVTYNLICSCGKVTVGCIECDLMLLPVLLNVKQ